MSNYSITHLPVDPITGYTSSLKSFEDGSTMLTKYDSESNIITTTETVMNSFCGCYNVTF